MTWIFRVTCSDEWDKANSYVCKYQSGMFVHVARYLLAVGTESHLFVTMLPDTGIGVTGHPDRYGCMLLEFKRCVQGSGTSQVYSSSIVVRASNPISITAVSALQLNMNAKCMHYCKRQ